MPVVIRTISEICFLIPSASNPPKARGRRGFVYHKLVAVSFDEEFAQLRGVSTKVYYFLLLGLTAMSVVLMVRIAGLFLSQALLILPAATASRFSRSLWAIMFVAVGLTALSNTAGLALSYQYDIPTGPFIVFLAVGFYVLSFLLRRGRA